MKSAPELIADYRRRTDPTRMTLREYVRRGVPMTEPASYDIEHEAPEDEKPGCLVILAGGLGVLVALAAVLYIFILKGVTGG
jgi:hypothetical protein